MLVVGDAKHRILVASKVLTLASKVFRAMFSRSFKESQELVERYVFFPLTGNTYCRLIRF